MKHISLLLLSLLAMLPASAGHRVLVPNVKSLQVVVNGDWMLPPVLTLGSDDAVEISFDELSHEYHRFNYTVERCEHDWTPSTSLFDSDWMEGFATNPIEQYDNSINTTVLYTHYAFTFPNDQCRLKMSGNYRVRITDEDDGDREVAVVELMVVEPLMQVGLSASTNTDVSLNNDYQQLSMTVVYNGLPVTNTREQIHTVVMQNRQEATARYDVRPTFTTPQSLKWEHNRDLIFHGGNEYRRFEVLALNHTTLGLAHVEWDGERYHAVPFPAEPRKNYLLEYDADGAFFIRNSDNSDNDITSDYVDIHYFYGPTKQLPTQRVFVYGLFATGPADDYTMEWDDERQCYHASITQKQGYYNYQVMTEQADGTVTMMPDDRSFFETENRYEALVYYKGPNDRSWRLTGFQEIVRK